MKKIIYLIITITILFSLSACKHKHRLVSFDEKAPTCTNEGIKEHWYCPECDTYFTDSEGVKSIAYEDLITTTIDHKDENKDFVCDSTCHNILITSEDLQQVINNSLSKTKVLVKEQYLPGASNISYYFDDNLLYINDDYYGEKYYFTIDDSTYLFTKSNKWTKEVTTEQITYNISYLFVNKLNLEVSTEISKYVCNYGVFEGKTMLEYTNSLGTKVMVKLNALGTLLEGGYICDESNNIIYTYEMIYGENEEIINDFNIILNGYEYKETTNTYNVYYSYSMQNVIDKAEVSSSTDNPATIMLMNDIKVEANKIDGII